MRIGASLGVCCAAMTRREAERVRERLSTEHPDRRTHSFILSELDGIWSVAKVALPALAVASGASKTPGGARLPNSVGDPVPGS